MDELTLDAFVYPTWSAPPQQIGRVNQEAAGDNSQLYSPTSGFPAINVPMGYTRDGALPAGMTVLGRAWDEAKLFRLVYAYEQATLHRRSPSARPTGGMRRSDLTPVHDAPIKGPVGSVYTPLQGV